MRAVARLREGSTWAGLAAIAAIWSPTAADLIPTIGSGLAELAGTVLAAVAIGTRDRDD